ncbi:MAG TPA: GNAT family N-acetyltransferase [Opitutaceae bacterium]|nr:GNAT family N-acetyltransferase [Opitutaceae bacterium]
MPSRPLVRIRAFRIADYGKVYAVWKKAEGVGLNESDSREAVARYLKRNPGLSRVAVSGRRVVAIVLCGHDGRRGYLHHLAVAGGWRRRGVGRALVAACLEDLRKAGIPKCNLFLYASNRPGRVFWRRLGWSVRADLRLVQRGTGMVSRPCRTTC